MNKKIILYIAMTLDGFIADENDQLSFLNPYQDNVLAKQSYEKLMDCTDTLLIGRKTYDVLNQLVDHWPYPNHHTYVFTSQSRESSKNITFTNQSISNLLLDLNQVPGKDIWVVGGGKLIQSLIEKDLIDEYQITIVPTLLGKGVPLFLEVQNKVDLKLSRVEYEDHLVFLIYTRK